ncbi:hypothetical protein BDIM_20770 [Brevundimonas diminuta ATCC 11568]|nr:hypothetical protein BDIM_20770 [Brevundimonas diminuta ATCC 11568]
MVHQGGDRPAQHGEQRKGQQGQPEADRLGVGQELAARDQKNPVHQAAPALSVLETD